MHYWVFNWWCPPELLFILHHHLFFRKEIYLFKCLYFSEDDIECLDMFLWLRGYQLITYATGNWRAGERWGSGRGVIQNGYSYVQREKGCQTSCVCTHLHYLLSCFQQHFCRLVSCFICKNLTLPLFKSDVFVRNDYSSPARSISVVMK